MTGRREILLPAGVFALFAAAYSLLFIVKHDFQFQTFGWDSGYFAQMLWKAGGGDFSRGTIYNFTLLEDKFQPFLFVLAPLVRIFPDIRVLLVTQAAVAVSAVFPLYLLAKKVTRSVLFALAAILAYCLLVTFQHAILDGFTQAFFMAPFLAWAFYFLEVKSWIYWLMAAGIVLIKEEFSLFLVPLGVVIFFQYHDSKKAILTVLGGAAVFIFLVYFLNPMISPDLRHWAHYSLGYGAGGSSPQEVVINLFTRPQKMLALLFDNPVKLTTVVVQFSSFGFLPLLSPATLGPLGYEYFVRFINTAQPPKWLAHDFDFGVILAVSAVYGAAFWRRHFDSRLLAVFLLAAALAGDYFFHGPINSLLKSQLYRQEAWAKNNHQVLAFVPRGTAVAANNSLVPHLAMREKIYLLPETGGAEYIVVDLHGGPNAYAPIDYGGTVRLVEKLIGEKKYRREVKIGEAWLLKKL